LAGDQARHDTIPALDGFRALAIIFVMLSHVGLERLFPGQFGVTLFFFLSGYLITTLLRRELERSGRIDFGGFYLRRAVRILPPLYLTILFVLGLNAAGAIPPMKLWAVPFDLVFLSNYFPYSSIPIGLWSLAVEEHFYMGFPLLFLLLARRLNFSQCALVFLGLCAVVLGIRLIEAQRVTDLHQVNFWTHTRLDSILFGSVLALWNNPVADREDHLPRGMTGYLIAAAFLIPTFAIRDEMFRMTWRYTLQGLGLVILFNVAIRDRRLAGPLLDNPFTNWVAALSYTLYLVHSALIRAFEPGIDQHAIWPDVFAIALAFLYAMAMRRWVELPMAAWRRRRERAAAAARPLPEPDLVRS
jgi:peptidoglycan/LPS O-acetylase OafA/YrhL